MSPSNQTKPAKFHCYTGIRYGSEEGFGRKNEVRKERWIRKRRRRSLGGDYREWRGLARNPNEAGPLVTMEDWSYADGRQGVPS